MQAILKLNPQNAQIVAQANALTMKINARKAQLIAEMTRICMEEEQKIMGHNLSGDPLIEAKI